MALEEKMFESVNGRYVYGKIFRRSRASNSQVNNTIWTIFDRIRDFMLVLVICKFAADRIKPEGAIEYGLS